MKNVSAIAIAFTYIGTLVGAGFASGQELKSYFVDFGVCGIAGFCLASFLLYILGKRIMLLCKEKDIYTYDMLLGVLSNKRLARIFDFFITIFLIGSTATMCSGMGGVLKQIFGIPPWIGCLFLMVVSIIVVEKGIGEISKLNLFIVPILIIVTIIISLTSFKGFNSIVFIQSNSLHSVFSSVIYVAYNIIMSISILPALAISADKKSIEKGTMWSGIIIAILGVLVSVALLSNYDIIQNVEIPLVVLSKKYLGFYIIMFLLEVFSTAVSSLYGVYGRLRENNKKLYIVALFAYLFSLLGFSNLVTYLYGVMGIIGVFMIFVLLKGEYK